MRILKVVFEENKYLKKNTATELLERCRITVYNFLKKLCTYSGKIITLTFISGPKCS